MIDSHCRIGRVTLKGGANLRIFRSSRERYSEWVLGRLKETTKEFAHELHGDACGFVIIAWNSKSAYLYDAETTKGAKVDRNTLPEWLAEAARRDNAETEARLVLRNG